MITADISTIENEVEVNFRQWLRPLASFLFPPIFLTDTSFLFITDFLLHVSLYGMFLIFGNVRCVGLRESTWNDNYPVALNCLNIIEMERSRDFILIYVLWHLVVHIIIHYECYYLTVIISGGDMDAVLLCQRALMDKCFTGELHKMEEKRQDLNDAHQPPLSEKRRTERE